MPPGTQRPRLGLAPRRSPRRSSGRDSRTGRNRAAPSPPSGDALERPARGQRHALVERQRRIVPGKILGFRGTPARTSDGAATSGRPTGRFERRRGRKPARNPSSQARCSGENGAFRRSGAESCRRHAVVQRRRGVARALGRLAIVRLAKARKARRPIPRGEMEAPQQGARRAPQLRRGDVADLAAQRRASPPPPPTMR